MGDLLFNFRADISKLEIPTEFNNPFSSCIPDVVDLAAKEFQAFISSESANWEHDFQVHKGKMFGVLVVQKDDQSFAYLGTVSGKLNGRTSCDKFVPSVFDDSVDDFFINKGMRELADMGKQIDASSSDLRILDLTRRRKHKSIALQKRLFSNYRFVNIRGLEKNVLQIFKSALLGNPPSAAGECAGPKLLQYALQKGLKPIAIAEFWWGKSPKNQQRKHGAFYPACENKCKPILEFMLDDLDLYNRAVTSPQKPL